MSGKGKTSWHPDDASADSGQGRAAAGPAMREGGGGSRPLHLLRPSSGWGGRWWGGAGMRTAQDHEQPPSPKLQQSRN